MIHRLKANKASDQNGYAGMSSNAPIAASEPTAMAKYGSPWMIVGELVG